MKDNKIFWKDGFSGECAGGYYFRAFDLVKFFIKVIVVLTLI